MSLDFDILCPEIDDILDEIGVEYQSIQGLILTEDDLKCVLYKKLTDLPSLSAPTRTEDDNILASQVHSELSWYDENRRLTLTPDITIIEPEHLSILGYRRHPTHSRYQSKKRTLTLTRSNKDFEFGGKAIVFELKFIRGPMGIYKSTANRIKSDYDKIMRLLSIQEDPSTVFCYQVVFNKTNRKCKEFEEFVDQNIASQSYKFVYKTGNFNPYHKKRVS